MTTLYQYNTLAALMAGLYEGNMTIDELLQHGDFGVGTLDGIDGELIVLDGKAYQAKGDKTLLAVPGNATVPYAAVLPHQADIRFSQTTAINEEELKAAIEQHFAGENLFYSVKVTGKFSKMHVRMAPGAKPGERFVDVSRNQPEYTEENISGTIVGLWTPAIFHGVSVAGFHWHFINDSKDFGGHILDFEMESGQIELGQVDQLNQAFPIHNQAFLKAHLNVDQLKKDIEIAEH